MAIQFHDVSKTFARTTNGANGRRVQALNPVNLEIKEGEFFCIIGPSGCGKSTLLNILAGLETPSSGHVKLEETIVSQPGPDRVVVFQEAGLMPWMTVQSNVEYGLKLQGLDKATRAERAQKYL